MATTDQHWVRKLRPSGTPPPPVSFAATVNAAIGQVGEGPVGFAVEVGYHLASRCIEEMPDLGGSANALDMLRLGAESASIRALLSIDSGALEGDGATEEVVDLMREYVHRGIRLDRVWAAIRFGHFLMSEYFMEACRELVSNEDQAATMADLSRRLFEVVNPFSLGASEAYTVEYERWISSAAAAREEAVRRVLARGEVDLSAASTTLRYELDNRFHLGLVLWKAAETTSGRRLPMHQVAEKLLLTLGAGQALTIPVGDAQLWAWGGAATNFEPDIATALGVEDCGYRMAIGEVGRGVAGFRNTHSQAVETARVARLNPNPDAGITVFGDVALVALLTSKIDSAKSFMARELGELCGSAPNLRDLRDTVLTYLESQRSPLTTASRLHIARNTVAYRVKRAEEIIGHNLDEREPEVWMALVISSALGECRSHVKPAERRAAARTRALVHAQ